jgi:hypothetical protein
MKTAWPLALIMTLGGATLMLTGISNNLAETVKSEINPHTMAAFRDGLYQARLEARRGEAPHLATGRWQRASDRELFVAGFRQGFAEFYAAHPDVKQRPDALRTERVSFDPPQASETAKPASSPAPEI